MKMLLLIFLLLPISTVAKVCSDDHFKEKNVFYCRQKCCGLARQCLPTCLNVTCETSDDCDGLSCCDHKCQKSSQCGNKKPPITVWLSAWLGCVVVVVGVLLVFCWCIKKKRGPLDPTISTEISDAFLDKDDRSESLTTVVTWTSKETILA